MPDYAQADVAHPYGKVQLQQRVNSVDPLMTGNPGAADSEITLESHVVDILRRQRAVRK